MDQLLASMWTESILPTAGGLLLLAGLAGAQTFEPLKEVPTTAEGPTHVVPLDIDGDGAPDLVVVDQGGSRITWFPGSPSGGYGPSQIIVADQFQVGCPRPGDLDGDLDVDLVVRDGATGALAWHENGGGGATWTEHSISGPLGALGSVVLADVDSDGDLDVLVVTLDDHEVLLFENLEAGGFAPGVVVTSAVPSAFFLEVADLDGDGHPDILVSGMQHFQTDSLHVLFNQGSGTFGPALTIASGALGISSMVACDLDEDGDLDVVASLASKIAVVWFENDGTGAFGAYQILAWPEAANEIRLADADLDGHLDLFASCSPGITPFVDSLFWSKGDGAGGLLSKTTLRDPNEELSCFALADLDGDGDVDLVVAAPQDDLIGTYENVTLFKAQLHGTCGLHCAEAGALTLQGEHLLDASVTVDGLPVPVLSATESELTISLEPDVPGGLHTIGLSSPAGATEWPDFLVRYPVLTGPAQVDPGSQLDLQLHNGEPGAYCVAVSGSLYSSPAPFEAAGWFHGLELDGVWILRSGLVPAGETSPLISLPPVGDPALSGVSLYLQAWTRQDAVGRAGFTSTLQVAVL